MSEGLYKIEENVRKTERKISVIGTGTFGCDIVTDITRTVNRLNTYNISTAAIDIKNHHKKVEANKIFILNENELKYQRLKNADKLAEKILDANWNELEKIINESELIYIVGGFGGTSCRAIIRALIERLKHYNKCSDTALIVVMPMPWEHERLELAEHEIITLSPKVDKIYRYSLFVGNSDVSFIDAVNNLKNTINLFVQGVSRGLAVINFYKEIQKMERAQEIIESVSDDVNLKRENGSDREREITVKVSKEKKVSEEKTETIELEFKISDE